jgi:TATA-box binding protein (TBP) (component of TFIID and TFIIIB)
MITMDPAMVQALTEVGKLVATGLVAFGGLKAALNGARDDIREIKADVKEIKSIQVDHTVRLALIENMPELRAKLKKMP